MRVDRVKWRDSLIRGDLVYVKLADKINSSIQSGIRPCVIVSNNVSNRNAGIVNVCPMTSREEKKNIPVHVQVEKNTSGIYLDKKSYVLIEQIVTIDKKQIISLAGHLEENSEIMTCINKAIIRQLGLENLFTNLAYQMSKKRKEKAA